MNCSCCNRSIWREIERFGSPDAPLCITCWLQGREECPVYAGPVTFSWAEELPLYRSVMGIAKPAPTPPMPAKRAKRARRAKVEVAK